MSKPPLEQHGRLRLSEVDRALLDIEAKPWKYAGNKVSAFRDDAGLSETAAYQRLNVLIDTEAAMAYDPRTTKRLLALREERQRSRSARRSRRDRV